MPPQGTVVSRRFREAARKAFPALDHNWRYRAFLDLLVFGGFIEGAYRPDLVVTHQAVLRALGLPPKTSSKVFQSGQFIQEFNDKVVGGKLVVGPYSYVHGAARTISLNRLDPAFTAALSQELETFHSVPDRERVHLVSGARWQASSAASLRERDRRDATSVPGTVSEAKALIDYLNALPVNSFTSAVKAHMLEAVQLAAQLPNAVVRRHQLALLHRITLQPQPFYGGSVEEKTVRIFARNASILQLRNEIKRVLIADLTTFDLRSAQLAIIAKDWNIPVLLTLLADPSRDVWSELSAALPCVPPAAAKSAAKKAIYAIAFGGGEAKVRGDLSRDLSDHLPNKALVNVDAFLEHPIVSSLFAHRKAKLAQVRKTGGATDCFGRRLKCKTPEEARSVLAQVSQAQEMQLLLPALALAKARPKDLRIMLWEHDGFSVHFARPDRKESTERSLVTAVNDECAKLGYLTKLVKK